MTSIEVGRPSAGASWGAVFAVGLLVGLAVGACIRDALAVEPCPCECRVRP